MIRPTELYPKSSECIWVLFDLRDREACEQLHRMRDLLQEESDLEALGPDHMVLWISGGALELPR